MLYVGGEPTGLRSDDNRWRQCDGVGCFRKYGTRAPTEPYLNLIRMNSENHIPSSLCLTLHVLDGEGQKLDMAKRLHQFGYVAVVMNSNRPGKVTSMPGWGYGSYRTARAVLFLGTDGCPERTIQCQLETG